MVYFAIPVEAYCIRRSPFSIPKDVTIFFMSMTMMF